MNKKNLKILFILPSFGIGGAEKNTLYLANYYNKIGYDVSIVVFSNDIELMAYLNEEIEFHLINTIRLRDGLIKLIKIISEINPKIIFSNMWPITLISQLAKICTFSNAKLVMIEHINLSQGLENTSLFERILAKIFHFFSRFINTKFVAVSTGVKFDLVSNYNLKSKQIKIIYNPVIDIVPSKFNISKNKIVGFEKEIKILAIGNLKKQKNYENLINSIDILIKRGYKIQCEILGDGGERIKLIELVNKLKLSKNIIFLGRIINVEEYYISTDVFVLSSAYEGLGNVLIEALSFGCRIVSTDCDFGPREILADGKYGVLVEVGDSFELANGIEKSLSLEINQYNLKKRSLEFTVEKIGDKYLEITR